MVIGAGRHHHAMASLLWGLTLELGGPGAQPSPFGRTGALRPLALAPGIPDIEAQEKRDRVSKRCLSKARGGGFAAHCGRSEGAASVKMLADLITETWGTPAGVVADRFPNPRLGGRWPTWT